LAISTATSWASISNHPDVEPLARPFEVPFTVDFRFRKIANRKGEKALLEKLGELNADTVVLARYMQVLSGEFLRAWNKPIVNIHHSFPARLRPASGHTSEAHYRGVKLIGATAHYVTEELDAGPIIAQATAAMTHRDNRRRPRAQGQGSGSDGARKGSPAPTSRSRCYCITTAQSCSNDYSSGRAGEELSERLANEMIGDQ